MEDTNLFKELEKKISNNPNHILLIDIKPAHHGNHPDKSVLQGLDLSGCISILLLNKDCKTVPQKFLSHFDFTVYFDGGKWWEQNVISDLSKFELPDLDRSVDALIAQLRTVNSFDIKNVRLVVCGEVMVAMAARIRQKYGILGPNPDDIARFTNKATMKQWARDGGIPTAKFERITPKKMRNDENEIRKLEKMLGYSMMFKPLHCTGSAGIVKIDSISDFINWLQDHQDSEQEYLAEEYLTGEEIFSVALIQNSDIQVFPGHLELYGPTYYGCVNTETPICVVNMDLNKNTEQCKAVDNFVRRTVEVFQPYDGGLAFVQSFLNKSGDIKLIEIAYRVPGKVANFAFKEVTVIYPESVQHMAQIRRLDLDRLIAKKANFFANILYQKKEGVVREIKKVPIGKLKSEVKVIEEVKASEKTRAPASVLDIAVRVFLWNDDPGAMKQDIDWLINDFRPVVMEG